MLLIYLTILIQMNIRQALNMLPITPLSFSKPMLNVTLTYMHILVKCEADDYVM